MKTSCSRMCSLVTQTPLFWSQSGNAAAFSRSANKRRALVVKVWLGVAFCWHFQLLMIPLIMSVLYVWAQFNSEMIVSFWFGTRFKVRASKPRSAQTRSRLLEGLLVVLLLLACKRPVKDVCRSVCRHIIYLGSSWSSTLSSEDRKYQLTRFVGSQRDEPDVLQRIGGVRSL